MGFYKGCVAFYKVFLVFCSGFDLIGEVFFTGGYSQCYQVGIRTRSRSGRSTESTL